MVETKERELEIRPPEGLAELAHALSAGVLILKPDGSLGGADERALSLLACRDRNELARCWESVRERICEQKKGSCKAATAD